MSLPKPSRINKQITIVAGTPVRLADPNTPSPVLAQELLITARLANDAAGIIRILDGVPLTTTLDAADAAQLTYEMRTGGSYGDPVGGAGGWNKTAPVDLRFMGVDGTVSGDKVIVSYVIR